MPQRSAVPLVAVALVLAVGCSGSQGSASADLVRPAALAPGICQQAAGPLNAVHRQVADLRADAGRAAAARPPLSAASRELQALPTAPGGSPVPQRVDALVQAVGFLRLGLDTHSADAGLLARTDDAAVQLARACGMR